jgi:Domain of unknown function (DUF4157)
MRPNSIQQKISISSPPLNACLQEKAIAPETIHQVAQAGIQMPASELPHRERIQRAFGHHNLGEVQAHFGPEAAKSALAMHAKAYTIGKHIVFAQKPDLSLAAHEAAHVVQQRGHVQLTDGIGKVGDPYEQHADAVAKRVMAGQSAETLLNKFAEPHNTLSSASGWSADIEKQIQGQAVKRC